MTKEEQARLWASRLRVIKEAGSETRVAGRPLLVSQGGQKVIRRNRLASCTH
jgi:hypothetical protein